MVEARSQDSEHCKPRVRVERVRRRRVVRLRKEYQRVGDRVCGGDDGGTQHGEKRWVEVDEEKGSALFLSTSDDLVRCRSLESLCVEGVHMVLNVSSPTQPKYVNVTVEKTDVPSAFDPACSLSTYTVVLTDVIHLENLLPVVLEYRVLNRHNESLEEGTIKEGGIVALNCRPFVKEDPHRLSMRVKDSDYPFPPFADAVVL